MESAGHLKVDKKWRVLSTLPLEKIGECLALKPWKNGECLALYHGENGECLALYHGEIRECLALYQGKIGEVNRQSRLSRSVCLGAN